MINKVFELNNIDLKIQKFFLFYGENNGHKNEIIKKIFNKKYLENTYRYEENEIINNEEKFFADILSSSFFENEKLIIISRASDKIKVIIEEIIERKVRDLTIILNANILEKKSKLRVYFEKNKETICVPFYADNNQTLSGIVNVFFRENKIPISQESINLIVQRSRGDRQNLSNELEKIKGFIKNKNKIDIKDLLKLTNLAENYDVSELIDNCLAKNKRKAINILNENNYSLEDCILIIRTFLIKSKRLLKLYQEHKNKKNIEDVISQFKPPIFWKDKEIVKQQIRNWSYESTENLIYKINDVELLIKKNSNNSLNILSDFIIEQATVVSN
jgi:DNA polymerase-3 subunit delta|tara:strand:- start:404 stop:1399 length:996 start_codon:yes stop_codon:yes gene_type:complete